MLAGRPSRPADLQVCGRPGAGSAPDIQCASLGAGCQAIVRQSCLACKASVAQPQALKESDSLIMTFDDRAFLPSTFLPSMPSDRALASRSKCQARRFELDKNKRTKAQVKSNLDSKRSRHPRSPQRNKVKQSNNKKLMALSLGSSSMFVDLTQHCNQVMYAYIYEPHAYHNLLLPKISAQIQRYGFRAEPERVLEFFFVSCK